MHFKILLMVKHVVMTTNMCHIQVTLTHPTYFTNNANTLFAKFHLDDTNGNYLLVDTYTQHRRFVFFMSPPLLANATRYVELALILTKKQRHDDDTAMTKKRSLAPAIGCSAVRKTALCCRRSCSFIAVYLQHGLTMFDEYITNNKTHSCTV